MPANSTQYQREYYAKHGGRINRNRVLDKAKQPLENMKSPTSS